MKTLQDKFDALLEQYCALQTNIDLNHYAPSVLAAILSTFSRKYGKVSDWPQDVRLALQIYPYELRLRFEKLWDNVAPE